MAQYYLTEADRETIRRLITEMPLRSHISPSPSSTSEPSPEIWVAYNATGTGIPALTPGSGTSYASPGCLYCEIFRFSGSDPTLYLSASGMWRYVYNVSDADLNQDFFLVSKTKDGRWIAAGGGGTLAIRFCQCAIAEDFEGTADSVNVDGVEPIDGGSSPVTSGTELLSVKNVGKFSGADGTQARILWNVEEQQWELFNVDRVMDLVTVDVKLQGMTLKHKRRKLWGFWEIGTGTWTDVFVGTDCT